MAWNKVRYNEMRDICQKDLKSGYKSFLDYLNEYKRLIGKEDYEGASAITDVLAMSDIHTSNTHPDIKSLNV